MLNELHNEDYLKWVTNLKSKIRIAHQRVALSVNEQLLQLYWDIGKDILERQENFGWGAKFIEQLATDLKHEFPDLKGFSRRNLYAIRQWYKFYSQKYQFVPRGVAQIP